jgi:hypothetical protein
MRGDKEAVLQKMIRYYESYEASTQDSRNLAHKSRRYYNGQQWTEGERRILADRGQPVITINRIASKVDYVSGMESKSRVDPKAHPREPNDEPAANVATATIQYVCEENDFHNEWSLSFENGFIEGTAAMEVKIEAALEDEGEGRIIVRHVPWDRVVIDPHSRFLDCRDAKFVGEVIWMDVEDAMEEWPDHEALLEHAGNSSSSYDDTTEDRPRWAVQDKNERKRIKIVHMQYRKGREWWTCTFVYGGFLEEPMVSPYLDRWKVPTKTLHLMSVKIDEENNRYGAIRHLLDPQDEVNHRRSKALDLLSRRQTIREKGAVDDPLKMKTELARTDSDLEVNPGKRFEIIPNTDMAAAQFQLLAESKGEIDAIGPNAALTGREESVQSGRAIQAKQQGGAVELEVVFSRLRALKLKVYQAIWLCAKQFWSAQRWIRISGEDNRDVHLVLNKEVTAAEMLMRQGRLNPDQLSEIMQASPEMAMQLGQVVAVENNLGEMNADIKLDESPDFVTLAQEQFEQLANMAAAGVQIPPQVLIKASGLRNKQELLDLIERGGATPEQQQAAAQQQAQQQEVQAQAIQLDMATKSAELDKLVAETQRILAQVQSERAKAAQTMTNIGSQMREDIAGVSMAQ